MRANSKASGTGASGSQWSRGSGRAADVCHRVASPVKQPAARGNAVDPHAHTARPAVG